MHRVFASVQQRAGGRQNSGDKYKEWINTNTVHGDNQVVANHRGTRKVAATGFISEHGLIRREDWAD